MNLQEIKKIMELFDNSGIAKFSIKQEGFELKLQKAGACGSVTAVTQAPMQVISQSPVTGDLFLQQCLHKHLLHQKIQADILLLRQW